MKIHLELGDFEAIPNISVQAVDNIVIVAIDDNITLEYDDRVNLIFILSLEEANFLQGLAAAGEYLRDTATMTIIDNDSRRYIIFTDA